MKFKAIDDIIMSDEDCNSPVIRKKLTKNKLTFWFLWLFYKVNCDFELSNEKEYCSWLNVDNSIDDFDWEIYSSIFDDEFGYIPDHTFDDESGHFSLANSYKSNKWARLVSEKLEPTDGACLKFYYYFEGSTANKKKEKFF